MLVVASLAIAITVVGIACAAAMWRRFDPEGWTDTTPAELLSAGMLLGAALWLAATWILAVTHTLTRPFLWTVAALVIAAAAAIVVRNLGRGTAPEAGDGAHRALRFLLPLFLATTAALWLALTAILAFMSTFTPAMLWITTSLVGVGAAVLVARRGRRSADGAAAANVARIALPLMPLFLWTLFALWRATVLPPNHHDALSYHLPKAVLMARAAGFERFVAPDHRISNYPANFELLLSQILILTRSDRVTEWLGTAAFLALLATTAALAQRWWRAAGTAIAGVLLVTASAPVVLLHSSTDKNDLLTAWFALAALLWGSRWVVRGGALPMLLTIVAIALGVGTKPTAAAVAFALAPFVAFRFLRGLRARTIGLRHLAGTVAGGLAAFLLGGGIAYITNFLSSRTTEAASMSPGTTNAVALAYGDWSNLWQVPYLLLTVPFSSETSTVWVPWRNEAWFWPHYEIYFSHFGRLFTVLALIAPLALGWFRREGSGRERAVACFATLFAVGIMLPTVLRPVGFFAAFARYFAFVVPVVACATIPPLLSVAYRHSRRLATGVIAVLAVVLTVEAAGVAVHDAFSPIEYVQYAMAHPGTRRIWFTPFRAGSVVDGLAGPRDKIAVDGSFDTWVYPAYGRQLTRDVVFLPPRATPDDVPADAGWVIVDRSWKALWGHPELKDLGDMKRYIGRGMPGPEDVRLFHALSADPRFELVFRDQVSNQAVFRRVKMSASR